MKFHDLYLTAASVFLASVMAGCCSAPACSEPREKEIKSFALVRSNQAECTVILPDGVPGEAAEAVEKFNDTLKTITGAMLPVSREDVSGNRILLNIRKADSLRTADNFTIDFPDGRTMRIEGTEYSVQWAFNHIIREFAHAEWILPESCGLSYTPMKDLAVPAEKIEVKDVTWSIGRHHSNKSTYWNQNMRPGIQSGHYLTRYAFPVEKYGKNNSWPAAIMPVHNGKKLTALPDPKSPLLYWQPCYSNPETARIAVENILEYLEKHPGMLSICLSSNDVTGFCECAECMKLDKRPNTRSESYFTFINRVAVEVCKKYPNLLILADAYTLNDLPPSFKLHPNVLVELAIDFGSCVSPECLEHHRKNIAEWAEKASMLGVWDYSWGYPYPVPRLYLPVHLDMLKYMAEHHAEFYLGQSWTVDAHEGPKQYLIGKLLWDGSQDMKKLEEEWYVRCVGEKAAPYLKAYFKVWNDYFTGRAKLTPWFKSAPTVYMTYNDVSCVYALREEDIQTADAAMRQVVALAGTDQEKKRAEVLMRLWRHTFLRLRLLGAGVYDPSGRIQTPEQARVLLETVLASPDHLKEYGEISRRIAEEKDIRYYYLSEAYIRQGASPVDRNFDMNLDGHVLAASEFHNQPDIKALMKKIAADSRLSDSLRTLAGLLSEPELHENQLPEGTAENGLTKQFFIRKGGDSDGRLSVTDQFAASGKNSFQVETRSRDVVFQISAAGLRSGKQYAFSFKSFIPRPSGEGYLQVWCIGSSDARYNRSRGLTPIKLSGSVWQSFTALSPVLTSDNLHIRIYLRNYEIGDKVYFDDLKLMEVGDIGAKSASPAPGSRK